MYILDRERQVSLIREMTQLRKDTDNWVVYYHHPTTNEMWKSYFPYGTGDGQGPKIMRKEPIPEDLNERIDQCLSSDVEDDAAGLGMDYSITPGMWEPVISFLEDNYRKYRRKQLNRFLDHLGIFDHQELFEKIGYDPAGDDLTAEHYTSLASRARKIRIKRFLFFF